MLYVYDIVLNFHDNFYEFYEWRKEDILYHIKKICLIRVNSKCFNEIYDNKVVFDSEFLLSIFNKCEYYLNRKTDNLAYAFLLTDSYRVIAISLDQNGKIAKYSSLLLDEEEEILNLCHKLGDTNLEYQIINKREKSEFHTREEKNIIKYIQDDILLDYKKKNISKLQYLFYEYFNQQSDDIDLIYEKLNEELAKGITKKHYDLYNLIKLTYTGKNA